MWLCGLAQKAYRFQGPVTKSRGSSVSSLARCIQGQGRQLQPMATSGPLGWTLFLYARRTSGDVIVRARPMPSGNSRPTCNYCYL